MKSSYVMVGMKHRGTVELVASLPRSEPLELVREPMNLYDRNAVQVWARAQHVGYVKATQAADLARRMDAAGTMRMPGKLRVSGGWPLIEADG